MDHSDLTSKHSIRRELPGIVLITVVVLALSGFSFWAYG